MGEIAKEEFVSRFEARIQELAGPAPDEAMRRYIRDAAEAAWNDPAQRADGPEECAETDYSYWED